MRKQKIFSVILFCLTIVGIITCCTVSVATKDVDSIAHRGVGLFDKNTISAFKRAKHFDAVECDIRTTLDREFFVSHDEEIKTKDNKKINISQTSLQELKEIVEDPLTIADLLATAKNLGLTAVIDIKSRDLLLEDAKKLVQEIKDAGYEEKCVIISYDPRVILLFKGITTAELQYVFNSDAEMNSRFCIDNGLNACANYKVVNKELVDKFHENNLKVNVWSVNDVFMQIYFGLIGVDYITSDLLR